MTDPLGLNLISLGDGDECGNFALIGLEIVRVHGLIGDLILCKVSADLVKAVFSGVKSSLEVLDLLGMVFVAFIEGAEEAIYEALQVFGSHFKNGQRGGYSSWGEWECEIGGILGFFGQWWYRQGSDRGRRRFV